MRKLAVCITLLFLVPVFVTVARAQQNSKPANTAAHSEAAAPAHFYKLDFVLEELDSADKPVNSRSFSTVVGTAGFRSGTILTGTKVPIATGAYNPKTEADKLLTQFQYIDVGVKITIRDVHQDESGLTFHVNAEVSSLATPVTIAGVSEPVIHQNTWDGDVLLSVGKRTTVFKSDSLDSKGSMQLAVTATRIE